MTYVKRRMGRRISFEVGEVTESLDNELSEEIMTPEKRKKAWRMNCDVREATEGL